MIRLFTVRPFRYTVSLDLFLYAFTFVCSFILTVWMRLYIMYDGVGVGCESVCGAGCVLVCVFVCACVCAYVCVLCCAAV